MFEIIKAGGWVMVPLVLASVFAMAITAERFWSLQTKRILPPDLVGEAWRALESGAANEQWVNDLRRGSPLGRVLAAGIANRTHSRGIIKESIEEAGRLVAHQLERYLNTLGTIAAVSPLMGLLGTVFGMIDMFSALKTHGVGDPAALSGGIAEALITTAAGLTIAIPTLYFYRFLRGKGDALVISMEQEALRLVEVLHGEREQDPA